MNSLNRRTALSTILTASTVAACPRIFGREAESSEDMARLAKYVYPKLAWSHTELNDFLDVAPDAGLESMLKSLQMIPHDKTIKKIKNRKGTIEKIQSQLLWISSNIVTYPFRDNEVINYHELTKWAGSEIGVDEWIVDTQPTFVIERAIQEKLFVDLWDKLTVPQREKVLEQIDTEGHIADHAAVASLSGAGALAALTLTVHLAGFAFYTTMSIVISAVAGFFGVTLPFVAYTTASSLVAFLTGPVGWALLAVSAAAGIAFAGRANPRKTAAAICQVHALKVAALKAANNTDESVFDVVGDPVKRQLFGGWRILGKNETIVLTLNSDGTFHGKSFVPSSLLRGEPEVIWEGKGKWSVREKALTIRRTHVWSRVYWSSNERHLYKNRKIVEITPTAIELEEDATLERL